MTVWDVLGAALRRWYVVLVGALCTGAAAYFVIGHAGVYWSQVDAVFLAPQSARYPNNLSTTSGSLISTAGIVEKIVNNSRSEQPATSSASATLIGQGVLDGYSIRLPDNGGQWAHNFNRQVLDVQVAGPTPEVVEARQAAILENITTTLADLQSDAEVAPENLITVEPSAPDPPVRYYAGDRTRALGMTLVLGAGLTLVAATVTDHRIQRRPAQSSGSRPGQARDRRSGPLWRSSALEVRRSGV